MSKYDFQYITRVLANLSGIPTRLFKNGLQTYYYSIVYLPKDPMVVYQNEILSIQEHVGYFITPEFHVYGVLNSNDYKLIIGPTTQILSSDQSLKKLAFQADIAKDDTAIFVDNMKTIFRMPLENLLTTLCSINYMLNGEKLELKDIAIHHNEQELMKKDIEEQRTKNVYENEKNAPTHQTLQVEEFLMDIIRKGSSKDLQEWLSNAPLVHAGILAYDQLRQLRNTFIVTATLVSRASIQGGMNAEDAFSLSDTYIQRVELLNSQSTILNLQYNMIIEFTEQVEKIRLGKNPNKLALEVSNYIHHHLSEPISTALMAKHFYLTRTHFSAKFKKETGMTLTDFILKEKTEEAKRLLRYSDKSISAIATYLGFSSYGHLTKVFKKYVECTPGEYREKYQ